jgi:NitT/TauT family transport system substrate-binding protein
MNAEATMDTRRTGSGFLLVTEIRARVIGIAVACVVCTSLPGVASAQATLQSATLRLDWLASGYHVPFFLALDRGYYREQGIDLQIADGKGSTTTIQVIASGSDTFGTANLSTMALGIARGNRSSPSPDSFKRAPTR